MTHVFCGDLIGDDGKKLATFGTHWEAVAAMIRLSNPDFRSTGGDRPEALAIEAAMRERIGLPPLAKA